MHRVLLASATDTWNYVVTFRTESIFPNLFGQ